mgnify:FL=1
MIIDRNITKYMMNSEETILQSLIRISENRFGFVFSITESGVLEGILTSGDFRRWVIEEKELDLYKPLSEISKKDFKFVLQGDEDSAHSILSEVIPCLPVLDSRKRLVAVIIKREDRIEIEKFTISEKSPVFIIAEVGNNHNGSIDLAKKLIDASVDSGADCVKFQLRNLESLYHNAGNNNDHREDLGSQYILDLLSKFQLDLEDMYTLFDYCNEKSILPLCTPWDVKSVEALEKYGISAYKVASADLTNYELLETLISTVKPLICSTGMSTELEIKDTVALLKRQGTAYALLHCNATYPPPYKDINLNYMSKLKEIGGCFVGYSGHERGIHIPVAAVAKGARIIEKHLTLDRTLEGNDHKISLLPNEFKTMVQNIRELEEATGSTSVRQISQGEMINREALAKSLVINRNLEPGEIISSEMIEIKSPGKGLQPNNKTKLIGREAKRSFKKGDFFYFSDLLDVQVHARNYKFKRAWGIPVRYHDYQYLLGKTNPDLLEFHLSYKDLTQDVHQFCSLPYNLDLVVHSPELFEGDHILDLCLDDNNYCKRSIKELQKVIDLTRELKKFFIKSERPLIVINVGGASKNGHLPEEQKKRGYRLLEKSLSEVDTEGIELIPQTMPPFPWHFGGRQFHNLFVMPNDIAEFCEKNNSRICLDISHSKLTCNLFNLSFKEFLSQVGPYVAHLHMGDALGVDGEGLQIGEGDIDFLALRTDLDQFVPASASFIPEIWQGHTNSGEGFWIALDKLEKWFMDDFHIGVID